MSKLISTGLNAGRQKGPEVVGAQGLYYHLADGRQVLDASNTGGPIGHHHPMMVEAMRNAVTNAPAINEGWNWANREHAAQDLIDIAFAGESNWIGGVRFFLSGSEANDAALSFAQSLTGRVALATRERAYHGMTGLSRHMTVQPHWHGGLSVEGGETREVPLTFPLKILPSTERALYLAPGQTQAPLPNLGEHADTVAATAATIIDYTQGGKYYDPQYQDGISKITRKAGSLWIADEVITGLGRSGRWFAFQGADSRPDIVTLGKPLAGGAAPAGAVVFSKRLVDELSNKSWQTYSTYRGHPIMVAAIRSYLNIMKTEALIDEVPALSAYCRKSLLSIAERHASVCRVDGDGLHWTIELHGPDWRQWDATTAGLPIASKVASAALEMGVMIGTSGEQTSLFIAPPLIVTQTDLERIFDVLDQALALADAELASA